MAIEPALLENGPLRIKKCRGGLMMYYVTDMYMGQALDQYGEAHGIELNTILGWLRHGMTVIDIGANIGTHTIPLADAVGPQGRVIAIEPQRTAHKLLCANVALNRFNHVDVVRAAAGAARGRIRVPVLDYAEKNNFGGIELRSNITTGGDAVPVVTIDSFALKSCHLIKIDVEGMEKDVLDGAAETIARCKPILHVENDREDRSPALIERILGLGYRAWWHVTPLFNPRNPYGNGENVFGSFCSFNLICVPADRPTRLDELPEVKSPDDGWRNIVARAKAAQESSRPHA
jgi:FkbM family methyltransferase